MSSVIRVENLGKKYNLRHQQREQYTAMRDVITDGFKSFARKLIHPFQFSTESGPSSEDFWALKDVTFDVKQGDRIGIIGRNGAGKSTLLKILSRITEPTTGRVIIKGRVASLLEVGTGFHPELTGRENIFLNGAILGMGRAEIRKKFDEIVDFAEIEKFLDTPVKRYSSGMYVRLAFAVAAHLEPEILIVDEVLAVGDAQFQKKCLGKMEDVSIKEGRTVLFVSHNLPLISQLCNKCTLFDGGKLIYTGQPVDSIIKYMSESAVDCAEYIHNSSNAESPVDLIAVRVKNNKRKLSVNHDHSCAIYIEMEYLVKRTVNDVRFVVRLASQEGSIVLASSDCDGLDAGQNSRSAGRYVSICKVPPLLLNEGAFCITVSADTPFVEVYFMQHDILRLNVEMTEGNFRKYPERWPGLIRPVLEWQTISPGIET